LHSQQIRCQLLAPLVSVFRPLLAEHTGEWPGENSEIGRRHSRVR
jgi:hypothetical protein